MKQIALPILLAFTISCGGGGSGGGATATPGGSGGGGAGGGGGSTTNAQIALQILQDCGVANINQLIEILGIGQATLDPSQPLPAFNITGIDLVGLTIGWDLDTDNDQVADAFGSFSITDGQGGIPNVDLSPLAAQGIAGLPTVLASIPDGGQFVVDFNIPDTLNTVGNLTASFLGGAVNTISVQVDAQDATSGCVATESVTDIPAASLLTGGVPNTAFDVTFSAPNGNLQGTVTFDGTNTAVIDVTLNGTDLFRFTLDLTTGLISVLP